MSRNIKVLRGGLKTVMTGNEIIFLLTCLILDSFLLSLLWSFYSYSYQIVMPALISHWPQSEQPSPFLLDLNLKVTAALAFPSSPATSTFRQNYNSIINLSYDTDVC